MPVLPDVLSELSGSAGRCGGLAAEMLKDRLELFALELKEAKIRLAQALILGVAGVALGIAGAVLLALGLVALLPQEWRAAALVALGLAALAATAAVIQSLCRRLSLRWGLFSQSLAELQKDAQCFSTDTSPK